LENRRRSARRPDFIPTNADARARGDGVIGDQRFVIAKVTIGEPVHEAIRQRVQGLGCAGLRNTGSARATRFRIGSYAQGSRSGECGIRRCVPVDMKFPERQRAAGRAESEDVIR